MLPTNKESTILMLKMPIPVWSGWELRRLNLELLRELMKFFALLTTKIPTDWDLKRNEIIYSLTKVNNATFSRMYTL